MNVYDLARVIGEKKIQKKQQQKRHTHPTHSPDLSIRHVFSQPAKLPQSTQKPRLVSHTLAAKSPQGRGGDEAECLLVAVKS